MYLTKGKTDVGRVRKQNQDVFTSEVLPGFGLVALVCDGMGGSKAGDVASATVRDVLMETLRDDSLRDGERTIGDLLRLGISRANEKVFRMAEENVDYSGMGTTAVAAVIRGNSACVLNVGDSRCYLVKDDGILRVTRDHSLVQMKLDAGELTPEEAANYPLRNYITRAVGTAPEVEADLFDLPLEGGTLLLCSDGLCGTVSEEEMARTVRENPVTAPEKLVEAAMKQGSSDNITALTVYRAEGVAERG